MRFVSLFLAVILYVGFISCTENDDNVVSNENEPTTPIGGDSAEEKSDVCKWASRLEVPELKSGNILHPVVTYEQAVNDSVMTFIYEWDPKKMHIRWSAFYFDSFTSQKNWKRKDWESTEWGGDPWHNDEYIEANMRTTYDNHRNNGHDRGHMVASGDRLYSSQANLETYMYSNMSPQLGAFNQDYWSQLEQKIQGLGGSRRFCDTLYVCKGATIDNDEDILETLKGIAVPKYYYMAVMRIKDGKYSAAGFLMKHTNEGYTKNMDLRPYAMSIDALEEKTGVNFFHNLPDDIESEIEANYEESVWFF